MDRLTTENYRELLIKNNDLEYRSACLGCENIQKCNPEEGVKCGFYKALEKLKEYEDLEEQGKLLKLPCAVGDTVYTIYSDEDGSFIEEPKVEEVSTHRVWIDSMYFDYDDFGKTVFLTREEADAALKELERSKEK